MKKVLLGSIEKVIGSIVYIRFINKRPEINNCLCLSNDKKILFEVVGFDSQDVAKCYIYGDPFGIKRGDSVELLDEKIKFPVGKALMGRVVDTFGEPQDGKGEIKATYNWPIKYKSDHLFENINYPNTIINTGIKAIDFFTPVLRGGKIGLFGGAGVGKTIILTELVNNLVVSEKQEKAPYCVFSAVGERIREANELHQALLSVGAMKKACIILGQMGKSSVIRHRSPLSAITLAEYLRDDLNSDVFFFIDNLYRFAQAGQEISTISGNLPSEGGYQPDLLSQISQVHERMVSVNGNYITSIEAIFMPSDDIFDLGVREVFPFLDSYLVLSRATYKEGKLPAVDLLNSNSNGLTREIAGHDHIHAYLEAKNVLEKARELERIVSLIGISELSLKDQLIYKRSILIKNYMTQNFFTTSAQTGKPGVFVKRSDTVEDVIGILEGKYDNVEPKKLSYVGRIPSNLTGQ